MQRKQQNKCDFLEYNYCKDGCERQNGYLFILSYIVFLTCAGTNKTTITGAIATVGVCNDAVKHGDVAHAK